MGVVVDVCENVVDVVDVDVVAVDDAADVLIVVDALLLVADSATLSCFDFFFFFAGSTLPPAAIAARFIISLSCVDDESINAVFESNNTTKCTPLFLLFSWLQLIDRWLRCRSSSSSFRKTSVAQTREQR